MLFVWNTIRNTIQYYI
uniref:Uncharacterized protein n=1 Tax=Lepeophtheirus salmonis TaxID=72036 RepID=A0A0K2TZ42_LEPSM